MAKEVKVRYDKGLKKFHIDYHKLLDIPDYRFEILKKLNSTHELVIMTETHLGSINKPEPLNHARTMEGLLTKYSLSYQVRPMEIPNPKQLFGMFSSGKKTVTHFAITFVLDQDALTRDLFDDLLCEFDVQIGYKRLKDKDVFFEDLLKGYVENVFDPNYFGESFYDSRVFDKFLATEDITTL